MSNVYVVCRGSYSDRYVDAVFDDKEKADEYMKIIGGECDIDAFEINKTSVERQDVYPYIVDFTDGHITSVEINDFALNKKNSILRRHYGKSPYRIFVEAKDSEHAKKIASDWYTMFKASRDYLFPYIDDEVVVVGRFGFTEYPLYDLSTGTILLRRGDNLIEGVNVKTRIFEL